VPTLLISPIPERTIENILATLVLGSAFKQSVRR
jgi:hypothetical protein